MRVRFWGTRGSIPSPGPTTVRYGGNTACVEVRSDEGTLVILDCGTGVRELGLALSGEMPVRGHILLSHTHWDHIQGFPFFVPALTPGNHFTIHAAHDEDKRLEDVLSGQQEYTYFPLSLHQMAAEMRFHEIVGPSFKIDNMQISLHELHHSHHAVGYRIEADGRVLVYASDHEPYAAFRQNGGNAPPTASHDGDQALVDFARNADLLILDAQYSAEEYAAQTGCGHSPIEYATDVALAAGAKRLALFHHDPAHSDETLDRFVIACQQRARAAGSILQVCAAVEHSEIVL